MENLKSSYARLARIARAGRDSFKEKYQNVYNKLRSAEVKIRDLTVSRDNWKEKTKNAIERLQKSELKIQEQEEVLKQKEKDILELKKKILKK